MCSLRNPKLILEYVPEIDDRTAEDSEPSHRPDYYERESPQAGELELIVAKNRQGPQCKITIGFQGHYSRALDMALT